MKLQLAIWIVLAFLGGSFFSCAAKTPEKKETSSQQAPKKLPAAAPAQKPEPSLRYEPMKETLFSSGYGAYCDSIAKYQPERYAHLTDEDFKRVAAELEIEPAAIKAVVVIEAGSQMRGFYAPGVPVINFDPTMYAQFKNKVKDKSGVKGENVPSGLTGYALKEYRELINARKNNAEGALMGTFWGMFQIGGFNYKRCGCESVEELVNKMSYSEFEQLELFAIFIKNSGMLEYLKNKNWAAFAKRYNGPGYAKRGYHTKMANAYKKFSAQM